MRLISACRPSLVFGEQVGAALSWLDVVCDGMEAEDYTVWPVSFPAYCAGADHERERIYFGGYPNDKGKPSVRLDAEMAVLPWPDRDTFRVVPTNGIPEGVAYRGFGNAIVPQAAAAFIRAFLEC